MFKKHQLSSLTITLSEYLDLGNMMFSLTLASLNNI